jgi:hypothetical protein
MGDMDVFGDPVHGAFQLSGIALQLSRTRQVQRLKRLKQLGLTCLVPRYSFATHTRWQHSLGVAHLAGVVGSSIAAAQPHLDVRSEDVEDLQLAGGSDSGIRTESASWNGACVLTAMHTAAYMPLPCPCQQQQHKGCDASMNCMCISCTASITQQAPYQQKSSHPFISMPMCPPHTQACSMTRGMAHSATCLNRRLCLP